MGFDLNDDVAALRGVVERSRSGLIDRESLVETLVLAAVAGEHVLVIGPPGTAKSEAVRRVALELGGSYFEYLLGRFTEPNEVFGPIDLKRLREGVVEVETTGMLPEAEVAFLDEIFLGSTAILNTLLGILNERTFRRGATTRAVPLRLCVGAANALPDDPALAAFADRFLVHSFVEPVPDPSLESMLEAGWALGAASGPMPIGMDAIDRLQQARLACDLRSVRPLIAAAIRRLRSNGVDLSDRRAVRAQHLVAAAATLDGRTTATDADLWPLPLVVATRDAQPVAREVLSDLVGAASNAALPFAAEVLSAGPSARAGRLAVAGKELLDSFTGEPDPDDRLKVEAVLREIDAGFAADAMPAQLAAIRGRLVDVLPAS